MQRSLYLLFACWLWASAASAQPKTAARFEQAYREGMALFDKGKYREAAARLGQAQTDVPENVFAAQARFMTGVAYLKAGQTDNAIQALTMLQGKYPGWKGNDRAGVLLTEAWLKAKRWRRAVQQMTRVSGGMEEQARAAAYAGLAACPADTLLALDRAFPRTQPVEARLAEAGKAPNARPEVKARARQLEEEGRITYLNLVDRPAMPVEGAVDVALMLPLKADPANPGSGRNVLAEMALGARLAAEDLARNGQAVSLHIYDTYRNADTVSRLLTLPEMKQCRLLLGPVLQGASEAAEFASFNGIAMVAPLTNQVRWQEGNTAAFLSEPSVEGIAKAVFAQVSGMTKAGVLYGNSASDSVLANALREEAQKAGIPVPLYKRVARNSASNISKFITESGLDSLSLLFIPNKEPMVRLQLVQALEVSKTKARIVTYGDILEDTEVPFSTFERLGIRFLYTDHIPAAPEGENSLTEHLTAALGLPPTDAAYKGYDLVYTLAPLVRAGKPADALRLSSPIRGQFGLTYDFTGGQANGEVPIYRMERGQLVRE